MATWYCFTMVEISVICHLIKILYTIPLEPVGIEWIEFLWQLHDTVCTDLIVDYWHWMRFLDCLEVQHKRKASKTKIKSNLSTWRQNFDCVEQMIDLNQFRSIFRAFSVANKVREYQILNESEVMKFISVDTSILKFLLTVNGSEINWNWFILVLFHSLRC